MPAWREARRMSRETLSVASRRSGEGPDPLAPLPPQERPRCWWCGERRKTRLRVGRLAGVGYGVYCEQCGPGGDILDMSC